MHSFSFNCWVLIVATITSRAVLPSLFILVSSVCKSLQCLISSLTQGGKGGHIFRLTCSVVLWGGRDIANKYCWHVWGVLAVDRPHWVCHSPRPHVLPGSTQLRSQCVLQGHCPKQVLRFMHFPDLSRSCSQVLHRGTDLDRLCVLCPFQVRATQVIRCLASALSQVGRAPYVPPWSWTLGFLDAPWEHSPRCAVCLLWGADIRL